MYSYIYMIYKKNKNNNHFLAQCTKNMSCIKVNISLCSIVKHDIIKESKNNESKKGLLFFEVDENIEIDDILLRIIKDKEMLELVLGKN